MGKFLLILGRGVGQVMFQNNALSGGLMLVGVLLNSWQMALLAVAGNIVGTLTAYLFGYSREVLKMVCMGSWDAGGDCDRGIYVDNFAFLAIIDCCFFAYPRGLYGFLVCNVLSPDLRLLLFCLYGYYCLSVLAGFLLYY